MPIPTNQIEEYRIKTEVAYNNFLKTYPERLEKLRLGKDSNNKNFQIPLAQNEVSQLIGVAAQNYHKMEKGRVNGGNNLTMQAAIGLSMIYGCPLDYIIKGDQANMQTQSSGKEGYMTDQIEMLKDSLQSQKEINRLLKEENERLKALIHG